MNTRTIKKTKNSMNLSRIFSLGVTAVSIAFLASSCTSFQEKLTEEAKDMQGTVLVYGSSTSALNNFAPLKNELRATYTNLKDNPETKVELCQERNLDSSNYLRCPEVYDKQLQSLATISDAIKKEKNIFVITNDEKLAKTLERLAAVRNLEMEKKYKPALVQLQSYKLTSTPFYKDYENKLKELSLKPKKDLLFVLKELENPNQKTPCDKRLSKMTSDALAGDPDLVKDEAIKKRVAQLAQKLNGEYTCSAILSEPPGDAYISTGYDLPINVNGRCTPTHGIKHLGLRVSANSALRFTGKRLQTYDITFFDSQGELAISEMSPTASENSFNISAVPRFEKTYAELIPLGSEIKPIYSLSSETSYVPKKVPVHYSREYAVRMANIKMPAEWESLEMENGQAATLAENGQFTMGGKKGSEPFDMMFGHPNGKYAEKIWSSYASVKIGESVYKLNQKGVEQVSKTKSEDGKTLKVVHHIPSENVKIIQSITGRLVNNQSQFMVSYVIKNEGQAGRKIGLRLLLDTWGGKTDGIPFVTPGNRKMGKTIHTKEIKFTPAFSSVWETIDAEKDNYVYLRNVLTGKGLVPPDEIAFAQWARANRTSWDYKVNAQLYITGDSAALLWWQPIEVAAGGSRYVATSFGSFVKPSSISFDLQDPDSGFGYLIVPLRNESDKPVPVMIRAENSDGTPATQKLQWTIPPKGSLYRSIPMNVVGSGATRLKVTEQYGNAQPITKEISVPLSEKDGRSANAPVWTNTKPYPVRYITNESGISFSAVIKDKSGRELGRGPLKKISSGKKNVYGADIQIPNNFTGEVDIEIYK